MTRPVLTDPEVLEAFAHPVRLDVLQYLMSDGSATARPARERSVTRPPTAVITCGRWPGPGWWSLGSPPDARERPWQATITGFEIEPDADPGTPAGRGAAAVRAASLALDQRRVRDYLTHRDRTTAAWRRADIYSTYTLRVTPDELRALGQKLDALIRPLIAAPRAADDGAELVQLGLHAFPREGWT